MLVLKIGGGSGIQIGPTVEDAADHIRDGGKMVLVLNVNGSFELIREPLVISQMSPFKHLLNNPAGFENFQHTHATDKVIKMMVHAASMVFQAPW